MDCKYSDMFRYLAICKDLQGVDLRICLLCSTRPFAQSELVTALSMHRQNVSKSVNGLVNKRILLKNLYNGKYKYSLNWNYIIE